MKNIYQTVFLCVLLIIGLSSSMVGCEGDTGPPGTPGKDLTAAPPPTCTQLTSLKLTDVAIVSATEVAATATVPAHCKLRGVIEGTINFEVLLPKTKDWNNKLYFGACGGFCGSIIDTSYRLTRGYATAATDTGHTGTSLDCSWAYNNYPAQENFAYRATHLTAVTAKEIISTYYNSAIKHSYIEGCSNGGGQGLMESQRYPNDFDGIIAGAPGALSVLGVTMMYMWNEQAMYPNPADLSNPVVSASKVPLITSALYANCDAADGLVDGLIQDPRDCTFDPAIDLPMCPGDVDGPNCFTTAQLAVIQKMYAGPSNSQGQIFPGHIYTGEEEWPMWFFGGKDMLGPGIPNVSFLALLNIVPYLIYNDASADWRNFNFETDVPLTYAYGKLYTPVNPNLNPFKNFGGKMIAYHGWSDGGNSPEMTVHYYHDVIDAMGGAAKVTDFFRLFMMPGMHHCRGGRGPDTADWLTALENWVEKGIAPDSIVASHSTGGKVDRTRPICPYPQQAAYKGTGSIDEADNFTCVDTGHSHPSPHFLLY